DSEYVISPQTTDPRFSGANRFTRYGTSQLSLGYMGYTNLFAAAHKYGDIWLENSPIKRPFIGNRCMKSGSGCPDNGMLAADFIMGNGAYHIPLTTTTGEAQYARGIFSEEAYTYFKNVPIGTEEVYQYHFCGTSNDYDVQAGET